MMLIARLFMEFKNVLRNVALVVLGSITFISGSSVAFNEMDSVVSKVGSVNTLTTTADAGLIDDVVARDKLSSVLASMRFLQADFYQRSTSASGELIEELTGQFYLSKPSRFRWDYRPEEGVDRGNAIVSNGEKLYVYDAELETVSVRAMQDVFDQVPTLILAQDNVDLSNLFSVQKLALNDGLEWFKMTPRSQDLSYEYLQLALSGDRLSVMRVKDAAGQTITVTFDEVQKPVNLNNSLFDFDIPKGTDILSQ